MLSAIPLNVRRKTVQRISSSQTCSLALRQSTAFRRHGKIVRRLLLLLLLVSAIAGSVFGYKPAMEYYAERNRPSFRTVTSDRGSITAVVNSTGTVKPVLQVTVGSFVSGPIEELCVEFNQPVEKDQILAKIDPRLYEASVARDQANLATRMADLQRIQAELQRAINDEARAKRLMENEGGFLSQSEMDLLLFTRVSLEAQLKIAEAGIEEAKANLQTSQANLEYCNIRAPVAGTVIDRKIDQGQTLAAQFQTPELFVIAPDMRKEMHVFASVDEADIGLIRAAQDAGKPVQFTVDAYPSDLFEGRIWQVRQSSSVVQNVVTYPVVVSAPNDALKLMPGMTANLAFEVESREDCLRIPNAALRFYPDRALVHPADLPILDGVAKDDSTASEAETPPPNAIAAGNAQANIRHVWYVENNLLRAIEIRTGISDYKFTEIVSGDLKPGKALVTGLEPKKS